MADPLSTSTESLWEIVEQSAFLEERLGDDFLPEIRAEHSAVGENRLAVWRRNCAKGNEQVFAKRLQWDGLDAARARGLVGRVRRANSEFPPWARVLREMIEFSREPSDEMKNDLASIRGERAIAFEEFLYPFLHLARKTLHKRSGAAYSLLADAAHRQWERSLLLTWEAITAETLDLEFTRFRADPNNSLPDLALRLGPPAAVTGAGTALETLIQLMVVGVGLALGAGRLSSKNPTP